MDNPLAAIPHGIASFLSQIAHDALAKGRDPIRDPQNFILDSELDGLIYQLTGSKPQPEPPVALSHTDEQVEKMRARNQRRARRQARNEKAAALEARQAASWMIPDGYDTINGVQVPRYKIG